MSKYKSIFSCLSCLFLCFYDVNGQVFRNLTEVEGTPIFSTFAFTQDKQGFMWFGTEAGLYRYNSKTLNRYYHGGQQNPRFIRDLATDAAGNIWVASTRTGLHLFNPYSDTFINFEPDSANVNSLSHNSVNCVIVDKQDQIWAGTQYGLSKVVRNQGEIKVTRYLQDVFSGQSLLIRSLSEDPAGNIWMASGDGLIKINNDGSKPILYRMSIGKTQVQTNELMSVYAAENGIVWLGSNATGLYQFNPATQEFKLVESLKAPNGEYPRVNKIVSDGKGRFWMATTEGLVHFDPVTQKSDWYVHRRGDLNSLGNTQLFSLYQDRQGGLWCGSFYAGVSYLHFDSPQFNFWPFASNDVRSGSFSNAWLGGSRSRRIWTISDNQQQLLVFDAHGRNPASFALKLSKDADYYSFYLDEKDMLWAAGNAVLTSIDLRTGIYRHYPLTIQGYSKPVNARTFVIFGDSSNRLWIGGYYGLLLFDQKKGTFVKQMYPIDNVRSVFEDSRQNIWIGGSNEIYRLGSRSDSSMILPLKPINIGPKAAEYVWRIAEDIWGNIWAAGTTGLFLYNQRRNKFEPNTDITGISIKDVISDSRGYLWLNATDKLYRYHPKAKTLQPYDHRDGLPESSLLIQAAGTADMDGNLYFSTNQGMFRFDPAAISTNNDIGPVMLTSLKLYNKEVSTGDSTGLLKEPLWRTKEIIFRYDQSVFTLEFALLNYVRSDINKYAYKIEGIDRDWNYVHTPSATYTNLPSGDYIFQVKAANSDGLWMKEPLKVKVTILPPWWRTWYAYLSYLLTLAGIVYVVTRFFWLRTSFRKENALNQAKLDFFTNISHEIRTHLTLISGPLEKAFQQVKDGKNADTNLNYARYNSDRLMILVDELLDFRKIQSGGISLRIQEYDVTKVIKSVIAAFEHTAGEKNIETSLSFQGSPVWLWFDIAQMQKVFYNLLSNAYKFTPEGGQVIIGITETSVETIITVEDNGTGMSAEHLKKLFTYYYQANSEKQGYGIGLALSKSIVERHHGYLTVESSQGTDNMPGRTAFSIRLLRQNAHFSDRELSFENTSSLKNVVLQPVPGLSSARPIGDDRKNTILIIEDNDQLRVFIRELFEGEFDTIEAENGRSGLELTNRYHPDLILSDIMMPDINGLEVCREIKNNVATAHIPVILLTARTQNDHIIQGLAAGADDYLAKPFDPRILKLKIGNMIQLREERRERYRKLLLTDQDAGSRIKNDVNEKFVNKLKQIVLANLSEPDFNVTELAGQVGVSISVLYRKVRSLTDVSVNDFIKTIRLTEGKKLIESGVYNVSEVALMVGFGDAKYFSKEFKKQFGENPSEIKKQVVSNPIDRNT